MKVIILALFASLAIGGVLGDEKSSAIEEINKKYNDMLKLAEALEKEIQKETRERLPDVEKETIEYGKNLIKETAEQIVEEIMKASRTAIVKGKPTSSFECLAKVIFEAREELSKVENGFVTRVYNVVSERESRLKVLMRSADLVADAVKELKDQAIKNIEKADTGIKPLKEEALKRIETGRKQLGIIQNSIHKPSLRDEYTAVKGSFEPKLKEVKEALFKKIQKCIA